MEAYLERVEEHKDSGLHQSYQVLVSKILIKFITGDMNIETRDGESLLVSCILDSIISGFIIAMSLYFCCFGCNKPHTLVNSLLY